MNIRPFWKNGYLILHPPVSLVSVTSIQSFWKNSSNQFAKCSFLLYYYSITTLNTLLSTDNILLSVIISYSFNFFSKTLSHKSLKFLWLEIAFQLHCAFNSLTTKKKLVKSPSMAKKQSHQMFGLNKTLLLQVRLWTWIDVPKILFQYYEGNLYRKV